MQHLHGQRLRGLGFNQLSIEVYNLNAIPVYGFNFFLYGSIFKALSSTLSHVDIVVHNFAIQLFEKPLLSYLKIQYLLVHFC